ncbi:MAG: hypothetical protein CMM01_08945 [Rhodopirellula sp.]|mgnify:CR=1 FL=1|nr:hypothetical protein [Rhodopirellula sp.]
MKIEETPSPSNKSLSALAMRSAGLQASNRKGAAFLLLIFVTAVVVMAFTQTALRGIISERSSERQHESKRQLETAIECSRVASGGGSFNKITLPLNPESDERIEVIREGDTITARWMLGNEERDSLTRTEPRT